MVAMRYAWAVAAFVLTVGCAKDERSELRAALVSNEPHRESRISAGLGERRQSRSGLSCSPGRKVNLPAIRSENRNASVGFARIPPPQHNALYRVLGHGSFCR